MRFRRRNGRIIVYALLRIALPSPSLANDPRSRDACADAAGKKCRGGRRFHHKRPHSAATQTYVIIVQSSVVVRNFQPIDNSIFILIGSLRFQIVRSARSTAPMLLRLRGRRDRCAIQLHRRPIVDRASRAHTIPSTRSNASIAVNSVMRYVNARTHDASCASNTATMRSFVRDATQPGRRLAAAAASQALRP